MLCAEFAHMAAALKMDLNKEELKEFGWLSTEDVASTKELRERFMSQQVLTRLYEDNHFTLDKEACDVQDGCSLFEEQ